MDGPWADYQDQGSQPEAPAPSGDGPWSAYQSPTAKDGPWADYQTKGAPSAATNKNGAPAQAEDLPPEEPGFLSNMGQAAKSGFMQDIRNLAGLPATLQGKAQQQPDEAPQPYQQPLTLSDIAHPSQALPKITYQLASSGSTLGAGIAGGIAGEAIAPEGGGLVGGAVAAGAATALGQLTPIFAREMQKPNADPNKAWDATLAQAGQAGLFSAAGWAAFGAKFFEGPVKSLLFQAFGVQPGIGMTERGVENWEQGKPLTEGMEGTYLGSAVSTAIPLAGYAAIRGMGAKAAPVASPELRQGVADMLDETAPTANTPRTPEQAAAAESEEAAAPPPAPPGEVPPNAPPAEKELADLVTPKPPSPMGEAAPVTEVGLGAPPPASVPASAESKSPYTMLDPDQLVLRPDLFQFKASDERGGTGALTGAKWDQTLTNPITAWQANDGTISPVNGHQRTILAQDSKAAGQPDVQVPARIFREADGYTPDFMRVLGAYQNIAEGSGTALDFAKVLRGKSAVPDDLSLPDIAPHNALAIQARGLAALSPDAFGMVEAGVVPDAYASFVGAMIADPAEQIATMDLLSKEHPDNAEQARIMVQDARNSGFLRGAQTTLFGDEDVATSLFPQRARVLDNAMKTLRRAGAVFRGALNGEDTLTAAGNVLTREGNLAGKSENDRLLTQLTVDGTKRGPVSDALTAAAADLAAGKSVSGVTSRFLASVRALEQRGPDEGVQHGTEIRGNGPAGEAGEVGQLPPIRPLSHSYTPEDLAAMKARFAAIPMREPPPIEEPPDFGERNSLLSRRAPLPPSTGPSLFGEPEREAIPKPEPEPTIRTDPRQMGLLGTEPTALQAQAARDAAGPRSGQEPANEGLFAEKETEQPGLLARREGDAAPREIDPEAKARLQDAAQRIMRAIGLPDKVGLNLVDRIQDGTADGRYTHGLIDLALDTPHGLLPAKLFHESIHALMDPALGLLGNGERRALEIGADRWLKQGTNRADLESRGYGQNELREEAIARMGEDALARGVNAPAPYYKMLNFLKGVGQWLRGEGFKTADDVFDSVMRGDKRAIAPSAAPETPPPPHGYLSPLDDLPKFSRRAQGQGEMPLGAPVKDDADFASRLERIPRIGASLGAAVNHLLDFGEQVKLMTVPMATGADAAKAMAKDYMNAKTLARHDGTQAIDWATKNFTPAELKEMWERADAESVALQSGKSPDGVGLDQLPPRQRAAVNATQRTAVAAFEQARAAGVHDIEALPSYVPRMVVGIGEPEGARVVRDIRTLMMATMRLQEATQGRILINRIREAGQRSGDQTVQVGGVGGGRPLNPFGADLKTSTSQLLHRKYLTTEETEAAARKIPGGDGFDWFTIKENPAFWESHVVGTDAKGKPIFQKSPIYVRGDFEGPLRAVMGGKSGAIYNGLMDLKGRMMTSIMYGVAHLGVIAGRAFPAMPNLVAGMREGYAAKSDPGTMRRLILGGLRPIGRNFGAQDIESFEQSPILTPGRSWTSQVLSFVPGLFDERAGTAVKAAIDRAGDFAHNTLLWNRVADIQVGLALRYERELIAKGVDPQSATRVATNFGNVFAGSLPREAMSDGARKVANTLLFSRSYRFGTMAALKDAIVGMPKDVQAQIMRDRGVQAMMGVNNVARRAAMGILLTDLAMYYVGKATLQSAANVMLQGNSLDDEGKGYLRRFMEEGERLMAHPLENMNPFSMVESLLPTHENEPGKGNRILVGYNKDGTGVYVRPVVGKTMEDTSDYFTQLRQTMLGIESPFIRAPVTLLTNEMSPGRQIYDPYAPMPVALGQAVSNLAQVAASSVVPKTALSAIYKIFTGQGGAFEAAQIVGGGLGFSVSHGFPGGPAEGERFAAKKSEDYQVRAALPGIRQQIKDGKMDDAIAAMDVLKIPPGERRAIIKNAQNPHAGGRQVQAFMRQATPEQVQRYQRDRAAVP